MCEKFVSDRLQISLLNKANLSELNKFYFPWNYKKTIGFLMISGGIEVN